MFRLGLMIGGAVGYVLGTRAGQERFQQIQQTYAKLKGSEPAQKMTGQVRDLANQTGQTLESKATEGMSRASEKMGGQGSSPGTQSSTMPPT